MKEAVKQRPESPAAKIERARVYCDLRQAFADYIKKTKQEPEKQQASDGSSLDLRRGIIWVTIKGEASKKRPDGTEIGSVFGIKNPGEIKFVMQSAREDLDTHVDYDLLQSEKITKKITFVPTSETPDMDNLQALPPSLLEVRLLTDFLRDPVRNQYLLRDSWNNPSNQSRPKA